MHLNRYPPPRFFLSCPEEGQLALQSRMGGLSRTGHELVHDDLVDGREEGVALRWGFDLVGLSLSEADELGAKSGHAISQRSRRGSSHLEKIIASSASPLRAVTQVKSAA